MSREEHSLECYLDIFQQLRSARMNSKAIVYAIKAVRFCLDNDMDIDVKLDCCIAIAAKSAALCSDLNEIDELIMLMNIAVVQLSSAISPCISNSSLKRNDVSAAATPVVTHRSTYSPRLCLCGFNNAVVPATTTKLSIVDESSIIFDENSEYTTTKIVSKSFSSGAAVELKTQIDSIIQMLEVKRTGYVKFS